MDRICRKKTHCEFNDFLQQISVSIVTSVHHFGNWPEMLLNSVNYGRPFILLIIFIFFPRLRGVSAL